MQAIPYKFALLPILLMCLATGLVQGEAELDPAAQYQVLDWKDLVPEGWEPPLIPKGHDQAETAGVDADAQAAGLDGQLVTLPGFMKPVVFEDNTVSEFVLVPFLPHHVKHHAHLDANQMVYVSLLEPLLVENPLEPIWVIGTMTLDSVFTDEGPAAYSIADGVTASYEYQ